MSFENPTALSVGMTGTLDGWRTRVAGRVVLGMDEGGETYYWNEFNLVDASGVGATLVYEETEHGPEWKLFKPFEPLRSLSVAEAALKRVGQMVELDGIPTRVSLVDQSRVCFVEGTAPEGVTVGDVADYFNADRSDRMLVVSWTGSEIEFFEGRDLSAGSVASAFGLQRAAVGFRPTESSLPGSDPQSGIFKLVGTGLFIAAVIAFGSTFFGSRSGGRSREPEPHRPAPALQLATGARGTLGASSYLVASRAVLAIGTVRSRFDRREYDLASADGHALLVQGLTGSSKEWHLFSRVNVPPGFSPFVAAAQRSGASVSFDDKKALVAELFQCGTLSAEGETGRTEWPAGIRYGFTARAGADWFIARWDEKGIALYRGAKLAESEVLKALGQKAP
ncbi:MAG: DUF4178 domain-containing protein [Opitutaceae bacterium]